MIVATGKPKSELSPGTISSLNLASGLVAGFAAAIISQPADTLLSKINKTKALPGETITSRLIKLTGELGARGLFTGMGARYVCSLCRRVLNILIGWSQFGHDWYSHCWTM